MCPDFCFLRLGQTDFMNSYQVLLKLINISFDVKPDLPTFNPVFAVEMNLL